MDNFKLKGKTVVVKDHENINQALKRFKKKIDDAGLLEELEIESLTQNLLHCVKRPHQQPKQDGVKNLKINNSHKNYIDIQFLIK